jgi:hypothetical protein
VVTSAEFWPRRPNKPIETQVTKRIELPIGWQHGTWQFSSNRWNSEWQTEKGRRDKRRRADNLHFALD